MPAFLQRYLLPNQGTSGGSSGQSESTSSSPNLSAPLLDRRGATAAGPQAGWTGVNPTAGTATAPAAMQSPLLTKSPPMSSDAGRRASGLMTTPRSQFAGGNATGDVESLSSSHSASAHSNFPATSDHPGVLMSPLGSASAHGSMISPSAAAGGKGAARGKAKEPKSFKASI